MLTNTFTFDVDFKKSNYINEPVVTQNDEVTFILNVYDDGLEYDLSNVTTYTLVSMRQDNQSVMTLGTKTATNQVTFNLGTTELDVVGRVNASIQLYDADGRVSTLPFTYQVLKDLVSNYVPSENEKTLIELVLGEAPIILDNAEQATTDLNNLNATVSANEVTRQDNEEVRQLEEQNRTADETIRNNNEQTRIINENNRVTSENNRDTNEQTRITNENKRIADELLRQQLQQEMSNLITNFETFDYSPTVTYNFPNLVTYNYSTYMVLQPITGITPVDDKVNYRLVAQKGLNGTGAVSSVNGILPDLNGDIQLTVNNFEDLRNHINAKIYDTEIHGMKMNDAKDGILVYDTVNDEWIEIKGGASDTLVSPITNFSGVSDADGKSILLSWTNPTNTEFLRVEVYMSNTDITNMDYVDVVSNATKIVDSPTLETYSQPSSHGIQYYFNAYAIHNVFGIEKNSTSSTLNIIATDTQPPANVTNISVLSDDGEFTLTWTNPADEDLNKVKVVMNEISYPTSDIDGVVIYEGTGTSVTVNSLTNDKQYYIRFFVSDVIGNVNDSTDMQVIATPSGIGSVSNFTISQNTAGTLFTLNWNNTTDTTYVKTEVYASITDLSLKTREQCISDGTLIYSGTDTTTTYVTTPNTIYYFKLFTEHLVSNVTRYDNGISGYKQAIDLEPPSTITNFTATPSDTTITLNWVNPTDSDFSKVIIRYSDTSYPTSTTDGNLAYEGTNTTITLSSLTNDIQYYFRAFTVDTNGNINTETTNQQITATPSAYKIYGVKIDTTNSNPETALTYTDDAIGFTPALMGASTFSYGSWEDKFPFNAIKPCVVLNGVVNYYLNPNDYTKKLDGSTADITSGNDGDVMVEFPKIWWKFETVGTDLYVRYTNTQVDSSYKCLAHTKGTTELDKVYVGAYLGYELSGKLRSLSGKTPTANKTIGAFRTLAQANGAGYEQMTYYQLLMLQVLYLIMFKDRNSQIALGRGYVDGNTASTVTGGANTKGLFYGETTGKQQMKFCGIEDFYGNLGYRVDGLVSDTNRNILITNQSFNDVGSGYANYGKASTVNIEGYISTVQGGTETGFIIKASSGSETTYYTDYGTLKTSSIPSFGGHWNYASDAGAFYIRLYDSSSIVASYIGARLTLY